MGKKRVKKMSKEEIILNNIKDNVINDYYTAGIKTEVVIDTLITPVITELIGSQIKHNGKLHLITKEFPMLKNRVLEKGIGNESDDKKRSILLLAPT